MATLLEKAKGLKTKRLSKVSDEEIELALAWVNDEVSFTQVMAVVQKKSGSAAYGKLAIALKAYLQNKNK